MSVESDRLGARLVELDLQLAELWVAGMSVGGGLAIHARKSELEDERRIVEEQLTGLQDGR